MLTIRKQIDSLQDEIKELEGSTPDKKAEYDKLQLLVSNKKESSKQHADLKKDRDVLTTAGQLLKEMG